MKKKNIQWLDKTHWKEHNGTEWNFFPLQTEKKVATDVVLEFKFKFYLRGQIDSFFHKQDICMPMIRPKSSITTMKFGRVWSTIYNHVHTSVLTFELENVRGYLRTHWQKKKSILLMLDLKMVLLITNIMGENRTQERTRYIHSP